MQPAEADSRERAVLVAVIRDDQEPRQAEEFLDELEFLAETADIRAVKRFTQRLAQPSARIYVGPGKLQEIADYCRVTIGSRGQMDVFLEKVREILEEESSHA